MIAQAWTPDQIAMTLVLLLVYALFLGYQLLKRREKLQNLAYFAAIIPFAYIWAIGTDALAALFFLVLLWTLPLARDLTLRYATSSGKKQHDYANAIILYAVAAGVYFLACAILPVLVPTIQAGAQDFGGLIWLPRLEATNPFLNPFRILLTVDIGLMIVPMLHEIKIAQQRIPVWPNIFLAIVFALPTIYVVYMWILDTGILLILGLLVGILYFIVLLSITKGKT